MPVDSFSVRQQSTRVLSAALAPGYLNPDWAMKRPMGTNLSATLFMASRADFRLATGTARRFRVAYLLPGGRVCLFTLSSALSRCLAKKRHFAMSCFGSMNLHVPNLVACGLIYLNR